MHDLKVTTFLEKSSGNNFSVSELSLHYNNTILHVCRSENTSQVYWFVILTILNDCLWTSDKLVSHFCLLNSISRYISKPEMSFRKSPALLCQ